LLEVCTIICLAVKRHLVSGHEISRLKHGLQLIMARYTRIISCRPCCNLYITDTPPVQLSSACITPYKLLSLTYKVLTTTQPLYLHHLISVQPPRSTHSSSLVILDRPPTSSSLRITDRFILSVRLTMSLESTSYVLSVNLISAPLSLSCLFMLLPHLLALSTHHSHHS